MDWDLYRALDAKAERICAESTVTVTFSYDEFVTAKRGIMLLRRWPKHKVDLELVDAEVAPLIGRVASAFASIPEVKDVRDEQKRMLDERLAEDG